MKVFCAFREYINSPIFLSKYDFESGLIDNIPKDKFYLILPEYFYKQYSNPISENPFNMYYYYNAFYVTGAKFIINYYNIGLVCIDYFNFVYIYLFNGDIQNFGYLNVSGYNLFNYDLRLIGIYKSVVRQYEFMNDFCYLYVDKDGVMLTDTGVVGTGINNSKPLKEINSIHGVVKAWLDGFDGIVIDDNNNRKIFKIVNNNFIIK